MSRAALKLLTVAHLLFLFFSLQIIITAMDRFVWFVLLVVMTHLVTEFTRVTGYARGQRHEMVLLNDVSMTRRFVCRKLWLSISILIVINCGA